jgi:hypothetical protein
MGVSRHRPARSEKRNSMSSVLRRRRNRLNHHSITRSRRTRPAASVQTGTFQNDHRPTRSSHRNSPAALPAHPIGEAGSSPTSTNRAAPSQASAAEEMDDAD